MHPSMNGYRPTYSNAGGPVTSASSLPPKVNKKAITRLRRVLQQIDTAGVWGSNPTRLPSLFVERRSAALMPDSVYTS